MHLRIGICDDELTVINYLQEFIELWAEKNGYTLTINSYESAESFLFAYADTKGFDILMLDIQMKRMDGIELAKKLRSENDKVQIVFITGIPDYIAEGYEVSALHYLIKPVEKETLYRVLDKASSRLNKKEASLILMIDNQMLRIPMGDILYCECFGHDVSIITASSSYNAKVTFATLSEMLDNSFIRCHRSYIVGLRHISSVTKSEVILDNEKILPISRRLYQETSQAFVNFFI